MAPKVTSVRAWECLDSRGHPTIGCEVALEPGASATALVPTGASTGQYEVADLRDGGDRYAGLGVRSAVAMIEREIAGRIVGWPADEVDELLDGPSNVTLGVSTAVAKAAAAAAGVPLWAHLAGDGPVSLPCPMVNIFSGGRHAEGGGTIQDYLAVPTGATSFAEAMEHVWRVRRRAAELVAAEHGTLWSRLVADEGGLALPGGDDERPLAMLAQAIAETGLPVGIAIDVAATQVPDPDALVDTLARWCATYPIVSVEDPLGDSDWDGWTKVTARLSPRQVIGDDLFATDADRVRTGAQHGAANAVLVKPNQVGTLSGAHQALTAARAVDYRTVVSARSGDTEDDAIADLAVGWNAGQIKVGSVHRSERLAKYNRLLRLEALDGIRYAVWPG
ncbi:phosphopyruvate hydratase [Actinophytocola oryzae]|uniref:Enolase n=1 Tax=Actinophytocola oryzae TaxID=502181 RepID=A0A4V6Q6Z6_9PSEU|nr:phosphopyruvate hydratase [Actinophytocola oryzae]TDV56441.1 enolase [Actinophytocola oryzae]